ncbi:MAG TPA: hypothetical protein VGY66_31100, partial [Gemmataceae bacterium]|nr:hypothetical protein [Gemmataceae bacterium]
MTKYCETCKKPIPQGLTSCPACNETVLLEPESAKPTPDASWSDLVNAPANVGEKDETLIASVVDDPPQDQPTKKAPPKTQLASAEELAQVVDEPAEEELVAQVVDEPEEQPLAAQVVEEQADQPLVAQVVDEPEEQPLVAKVVDEPEEEALVAQVVDEPQEDQLVAQVVDEPEEEALVANVVDEPSDQALPAEVSHDPVDDQALAALIEESSDHAEPVEELAAEVTEDPISAESNTADEPDSDVNLGAPVEKGPSEMDLLAAESAGTPSESMLDDVFASGQLPIEESTSAVDLGSSSVLEIPDEILKAAEKHEDSDKAPPDETRLQLASMPDKTEDEVMDLGEVDEADKAQAKPAKPAPKRAKKPIEPKSPKTKLGKKSIPTQLAPESEADEDATLAEEPKPGPKSQRAPAAEQPAEATEQIEAVDESDVVSEAVDEEELTAVVEEDKSAEETLLAEEEAAAVSKEDTEALAEEAADEPVKAKGKGKKVTPAQADDEGTLAGLAEGEAEESTAVAVEEEERPKKAKAAKPARPRYGRRWLGGISLGLILG